MREADNNSAYAFTGSIGFPFTSGMGRTGAPTFCKVFVDLTTNSRSGVPTRTSPLQACLERLNCLLVGGARLLCLSIANKPYDIHTFIAGLKGPRLVDRRYICVSR